MKKNILNTMVVLVFLLLLAGCQTDYQGEILNNVKGDIVFAIEDNSTIMNLTNKAVRVEWNANDQDSYIVNYYWAVSADTSINASNARQRISTWNRTSNNYAMVSFPYKDENPNISLVDTFFTDVTVNPPTVIKYVYSRIFLYAQDAEGNVTNVKQKGYWRTNFRPKDLRVKCAEFGWVPSDSVGVAPHEFTSYQAAGKPTVFLRDVQKVKFTWSADDPDGTDVEKVYKWELKKIITPGELTQAQIEDSVTMMSFPDILIKSTDWGLGNKEVIVDSLVFANGPGYYKLIVRVMDDAQEESLSPTYNIFEAIKPLFDRGVLVLNKSTKFVDGDTSAYQLGNPNTEYITNFYKNLFNSCGYTEDNSNPLKQVAFITNASVTDNPTIKLMTRYRLVVVVAEDRKPDEAILAEGSQYLGFLLKDYMQLGGKVMLVGGNMLSRMAAVDVYQEPTKVVISPSSMKAQYFGLSSVTRGEQYSKSRSSIDWNNYDFIGTKPFTHIQDTLYSMRVDSTRINRWWRKGVSGSYYIVKGNGIFLPGVLTLKAFKGEICMGYESVYQDPTLSQDASLVTAGGYNGSATKEVINRNEEDGLMPGQYSALATRYKSVGDKYRTAIIGVPLYFMDNTNGDVTKNMDAMLRWFKLSQIPHSVESVK